MRTGQNEKHYTAFNLPLSAIPTDHGPAKAGHYVRIEHGATGDASVAQDSVLRRVTGKLIAESAKSRYTQPP